IKIILREAVSSTYFLKFRKTYQFNGKEHLLWLSVIISLITEYTPLDNLTYIPFKDLTLFI
ncbi:TPA: hypothetical protein ACHU77_002087, partial [Streptococcus suis]